MQLQMQVTSETTSYRTRDGSLEIQFSIIQYPESWRIYVTSPPDYKGRPEDPISTFRIYDEAKGIFFVNWLPTPMSLRAAEAAAIVWSEFTSCYISTGESLVSQYIHAYSSDQNSEE